MFKWHFFMPHICICIAGTLWVGGMKEQSDSRTGWQHALQRGVHWQIVQSSWSSTLCTRAGVQFQEQQALEYKQAQIKIEFYLFLSPVVRFHSPDVFHLRGEVLHMATCCEGRMRKIAPLLVLCHGWVHGRAASGTSYQSQAQHWNLDPGFHY